jgi:hypothetical protein
MINVLFLKHAFPTTGGLACCDIWDTIAVSFDSDEWGNSNIDIQKKSIDESANIIKASDKSTYTIKSSIYSYPNNINICKCQAGYEFSPFISGEELSIILLFSFFYRLF